MLWVGLISLATAAAGGLIGVPLIRGWIQRITGRDINKLNMLFDRVRISIIIVGTVIGAAILLQNYYEKVMAQKERGEIKEDLRKSQEEIVRLRDLAGRVDYHPLSPALRQELISDLRLVHNRFADIPLKIYVMMRGGNQSRGRVAQDLAQILQEAMFDAVVPRNSVYEQLRIIPDMQILTAAVHSDLADALARILSRVINTNFSIHLNEPDAGRMWIHINGDPLFMSNGVITFR